MKKPVVLKKGAEVARKIGNPETVPQQRSTATNGQANGSATKSAGPAKRPIAASYSDGASAPKRPSPKAETCIPIAAVNQFQRGLSIKGRCTSKSAMRTWQNERGSGNLFSFDLSDDSGEIRVTAFKEHAKQLHPQIEIGQVYIVARPAVKMANRKFSTLPHEYELSINDDTVVVPGDDNDTACPQIEYNFVPLNELANASADSFVDVVAIAHRIGDVQTLTQKTTQKELQKRDITLVDDSNAEISLTIWGKEAEGFSAMPGSALLIKRAKVSTYNNRSLTASAGFSMQIDPNHPAAIHLKSWYEEVKENLQTIALTTATMRDTNEKMIFQLLYEAAHTSEPVWANVRLTVTHLLRTNAYDACPTEKCHKRVMDMNNGSFNCTKCNKTVEPEKRFIQALIISDHTGELIVSLFHDQFLSIIGHSREELATMGPEQIDVIVARLGFRQFNMKLKVFRETYQENTRTKANVFEIRPLDYLSQTRRTLANIRHLLAP